MPNDPSSDSSKTPKTYHKTASGRALSTVKSHSTPKELKLYGSCFCPFVQRVWISLELKGLEYEYVEVDPYAKPASLLEVNPRGLVPALRDGEWACNESSVIMEYLEDISPPTTYPLLPHPPKSRAHSRLWTDDINRHILPAFYTYLQAQSPTAQQAGALNLRTHLSTLIRAANPTGPFFLGPEISFVDVQLAPWLLRMSRVLKPYRGWCFEDDGSSGGDDVEKEELGERWRRWVDAVEGNEGVQRTTSEDTLYLESYERYAENRPGTSQVARAINEGRGLP